MKFFLGILVLVLILTNITLAQSALPECEGNDKNISKFSGKHFLMVKKWTSCQGTGIGPKGEKYVGEFYKGKFHGEGIFTKDGRKYVGQYKNHKRHGQGTYTYANGDKYVGEWIKHKYGKQGTYTYANGDKYVGEWKKNKYNVSDNQRGRNGTGTCTYANGDKYVGRWKKGLRHGKGIFTYANGKIEEGIWKKDKLVKLKQ